MTTDDRCEAAHADDPTPCDGGPHDAVTILDRGGATATGCEHHAARLLASLDGARIATASVDGAAVRTFKAAQSIRPFPWLEHAPRTGPESRSHDENRRTK